MNTSNNTTRTALILGATGSFGSVMAAELLARGWQVLALQRNPDAARAELPMLDVTWLAGDAMNADDVANAAAGVQLIVHAVNPPKYQRWRELALPMLNNSIAAARAQNARILLPGVVYNFAPHDATAIPEDAVQQPLTQKGQVRVEMEALLKASGVRILILRAGDYFGGRGTNAWFHYIFKAGKPLTSMLYPGHNDVVHDWAYLPDMASTAAQILDRESELQTFERFHFSSYQLSGQQFIDTVRQVSQKPKLPIKRLPWLLIRIAALFASLPRELLEMRYLWQKPVLLDNRRLLKFLGHVPATPIQEALKTSLTEMGIDV